MLELRGEDLHHLRTVLRLRVGEHVKVFDGIQNVADCEIVSVTKECAVLRILERGRVDPPSMRLHLGVALLQPHKIDLIVQKAAEWCARSLSPVVTARSRAIAAPKTDRWRRIAIEAAKQSEAPAILAVQEAAELESYLDLAVGRRLIFDEAGGRPLREILSDSAPSELTLLVGPEGGWERSEVQRAVDRGFERVTLGRRNFRSETAAISALSIIMHFWGVEMPR